MPTKSPSLKPKSTKKAGRETLPDESDTESQSKTTGRSRCPVAGFGASAGGLEAFSEVLAHLPDDTGMAFVLVQHLDPKHPSVLAELLARSSSMPVRKSGMERR